MTDPQQPGEARETEVRDFLRRQSAEVRVPEPPVAVLLRVGAATGRRRRRAQTFAAAATALAAVSVGVLMGGQGNDPSPAPAPLPAPTETAGPDGAVAWDNLEPTQPRFPTGVRAAFAAVDVTGDLDLVSRPETRLRFTVTLTSPTDLPLAPCPDYTIDKGYSLDDHTAERLRLNCAGVPFQDDAGRPYLPARTPVSFAMETIGESTDLPDISWTLEVPKRSGGTTEGHVVEGMVVVTDDGQPPVSAEGFCAGLRFQGRDYQVSEVQPGVGVGRQEGTAEGVDCGSSGNRTVPVYSANEEDPEDALTASYPDYVLHYSRAGSWELQPVPYPTGLTSGSGDVRASDLGRARAFARFAVRPTTALRDAAGLSQNLMIGTTTTFVELPRERQPDPGRWTVSAPGFAATDGRINALDVLREHLARRLLTSFTEGNGNPAADDLVVTVGDHTRCSDPATPAAEGFAGLRHVAIQPSPDTYESCLDWFAIDLWIDADDDIVTVGLDLREP